MGYDFDSIPNRTYAELNVLQLGWSVDLERQADASSASQTGNTTETERRKREHKESIRRRLVRQ